MARWELRRSTPSTVVPDLVVTLEPELPEHVRIRCPECQWQPAASSRWYCSRQDHPEYFDGGCGTAWNTFATHGRCPGCAHQWRWTACLTCGQWSPHLAWYDVDPSDPAS